MEAELQLVDAVTVAVETMKVLAPLRFGGRRAEHAGTIRIRVVDR